MLTDAQMSRIMTLFDAAATEDAMRLFDTLHRTDDVRAEQPMYTLDDAPLTHEAQAHIIRVSERQSVQTSRELATYSADELLAALREKTGQPNGMFVKREWICDAERFLKELLELSEDAIADCWLGSNEKPDAAWIRVRHLLTTNQAHATYHDATITRERLDALLEGKG